MDPNAKPIPKCVFPGNGWSYEIQGSLEECMGNMDEILTPQLLITNNDALKKGQRLTVVKQPLITQPSDVLQNGYIMLGRVDDLVNIKFLNSHNIQTIVDCTITNKSPQSVFINRVFRPSSKLLQIWKNKDYRLNKTQFKDLILSLE